MVSYLEYLKEKLMAMKLEIELELLMVSYLEDLKEKMQPLMSQLKDVSQTVGNLQGLNKRVMETSKINQQKVTHESKRTSELFGKLAQLQAVTKKLSQPGNVGTSKISKQEENEKYAMLKADIQSRMAAAQEGNHEERANLKKMLRMLDGKVQNTKLGIIDLCNKNSEFI